jgi:hypothetical protein
MGKVEIRIPAGLDPTGLDPGEDESGHHRLVGIAGNQEIVAAAGYGQHCRLDR